MIVPETFGGPQQAYKRYTTCDAYGNCYNNRSSWSYWGRWVLVAIVIVFFIALFLFWTCLQNRRRRRRGMQPHYGTGWMMHGQQPQYGNGWFGHNKGGNNNNNNNSNSYQQQPPPPQYTAAAPPVGSQYTGQTFNSNEGYYGHHNNDTPLQQPANSYHPRGGEPAYEPPVGPPPAKN